MCAGFFLHRHHPENRNNLHGSDTALPNLGEPGQCVSCRSSCQDDAASLGGSAGGCVWQSFLLEMCSKCLPCPGHWQHSHDMGGILTALCLKVAPALPCTKTAQTSCGKPPALSSLPVCRSSYPMDTCHVVQ